MEHYAGLDVSLKEISICVVDRDGRMVARGTCPADPEGVAGWFRNRSLEPNRIVHESGMLSIWLQRGLERIGLAATCIDARKAHKSLSARLNKSDAGDAEGLAQLARTGWFTPVHIRTEASDRLRALIGARERLFRLRKDLEGHIRGVLKTFGIRMTGISQGRQRQAFRDQLAEAGETDPVLRVIADGFIAAHATLCQAAADLDAALKRKARDHSVARRLMTIPGVGPVNALSFIALIDDPSRFGRTSDVGAFLGLTPKRHQSGEIDWSGRVSKCGDSTMRGLLFEAAASVIRQVKRFSALKSWAVRLAGRRGFRKAAVATARKIAVLMLTLWKNETEYHWTKEAAA
ncbi:IS110 family transposase [Psychromarinibacter sp. C21-152]|uniref:IS110 family transposase n=1 Tax=Psychromarinibacter sediminicola TaxID=3033385 RepID=A0AAE3NX74_9RHOB|nr:IS110 family transposase [Psychromarinibacter sediminicola]MDF0603951.1 IS110 family transposase [Psychromarinibacter sediminicola]